MTYGRLAPGIGSELLGLIKHILTTNQHIKLTYLLYHCLISFNIFKIFACTEEVLVGNKISECELGLLIKSQLLTQALEIFNVAYSHIEVVKSCRQQSLD